jgi:hypothetical protein
MRICRSGVSQHLKKALKVVREFAVRMSVISLFMRNRVFSVFRLSEIGESKNRQDVWFYAFCAFYAWWLKRCVKDKSKTKILEMRNFALYEYVTAFCRIQMARNLSLLCSEKHARHVKNHQIIERK